MAGGLAPGFLTASWARSESSPVIGVSQSLGLLSPHEQPRMAPRL